MNLIAECHCPVKLTRLNSLRGFKNCVHFIDHKKFERECAKYKVKTQFHYYFLPNLNVVSVFFIANVSKILLNTFVKKSKKKAIACYSLEASKIYYAC